MFDSGRAQEVDIDIWEVVSIKASNSVLASICVHWRRRNRIARCRWASTGIRGTRELRPRRRHRRAAKCRHLRPEVPHRLRRVRAHCRKHKCPWFQGLLWRNTAEVLSRDPRQSPRPRPLLSGILPRLVLVFSSWSRQANLLAKRWSWLARRYSIPFWNGRSRGLRGRAVPATERNVVDRQGRDKTIRSMFDLPPFEFKSPLICVLSSSRCVYHCNFFFYW